MMNTDKMQFAQADFERLTKALCSWFVRRDGKYYSLSRLATKLSKDDVIYIALGRFRDEFAEIELADDLLRAVFNKAIMEKHGEPEMTIAVWNGREVCTPEMPAE